MSISGAVARRYAVALTEVVTAHGEAREVQEELSAWEEMTRSNPMLLEIFRNPTIPYEQKRRMVTELIRRTRMRPTTANYVLVLLQNQRLADLEEINKAFAQELDRRAGVVTAEVTTARPLAPQTQESLRARLAQMTGSKVRLKFALDSELIGGVVTRIGSTIYDGSVRNQLEQVRQRMSGEQ